MANEKRLIDDFVSICKRCDHYLVCEYADNETAECSQYKATTVDAKPVVHGRWIHIVEDGNGGCYGFCSRCSTEHHADSASALKAFHRYCRWCGADMMERSEGE